MDNKLKVAKSFIELHAGLLIIQPLKNLSKSSHNWPFNFLGNCHFLRTANSSCTSRCKQKRQTIKSRVRNLVQLGKKGENLTDHNHVYRTTRHVNSWSPEDES